MLARARTSLRQCYSCLYTLGGVRGVHDSVAAGGSDKTAAPDVSGPEGTRSAIFGAYPTRRRGVRAALRAASRPDRAEAWRRDPVSVMRNSPQRQCIVSLERLPTAYMLNLRGLLLNNTGDGNDGARRVVAAPDGLHHPRWTQRRAGPGAWVALRPDALARVVKGEGTLLTATQLTGGKRSLAQLTSGPPVLLPGAAEQVEAGLGERICEELELARLRVMSAAATAYSPEHAVLRALTPDEAVALNEGVAPRHAVAVMDVRFGAADRLTPPERAHPSVPLLVRPGTDSPSVPLFPLHALLGPSPRTAALVDDVLAAEEGYARRCGAKFHPRAPTPSYVAVQAGLAPGGVPLAVALWRLALWHGQCWEDIPGAGEQEGGVTA